MSVYDVGRYLPQWAHGGRKHTIRLARKSPQREGDQPHHGWSHHFAHFYKITGKAVPGTVILTHSPAPQESSYSSSLMLGSLGYQWVRSDHGATQMHAPPLPAHVTLVEIPHVPSRDQLLAPSALPHVLSLFTMPLSFTVHKDVHTWSSCSGKQMKPRKTLVFQKLQPGWEPACSVPGGRQ